MRRTVRVLVVALVLWNAGFLALSWGLALHSEDEHPPIGRFVDVDGLRVHLNDRGAPPGDPSAPVVVLLHGASTSLLDFEPSLAPALAAAFRVVSVDRPGHGYSERGTPRASRGASEYDSSEIDLTAADRSENDPTDDDAERGTSDRPWLDPYAQAAVVRGALEALGIERAIWIGHSWAGSVVLAALLEEPEHVRAGILLGGATHPWEGGSAWHAELAARPLLGRAFAWQYVEPGGRLSLDAAIESVFSPEPVPADYVERTGVTLSLRPWTYRHNAEDLTRLSTHLDAQSDRYPTIERPLLSITGTADDVVPAWNHDARLAEQLPALRSVALEGAGHAFHHTRTARVAELVAAFVRNLPDR